MDQQNMSNIPSAEGFKGVEQKSIAASGDTLKTLNSGIKDHIKNLVKAREEAIKTFTQEKAGTKMTAEALYTTVRAYESQISILKRIQEETSKLSGFMGVLKNTGVSALSKLGLGAVTFEQGAWGATAAVALLALKIVDAQKVMSSFATLTAMVYGKMGAKAGTKFFGEFFTPGDEWKKNKAFVSDSYRREFLEAIFHTGLYKFDNATGKTFQNSTERLLALSKAFGISTREMASDWYMLSDIFQQDTTKSGKQLEGISSLAGKLGVERSKFLKTTIGLVSSFKLENIGVQEVTSVYGAYIEKLKTSKEVSADLTTSTISGLAKLNTSQIAAYIGYTRGLRGKSLGDATVEFLQQQAGASGFESRLQLAYNTIKKMRSDPKLSGIFGSGKMGEMKLVHTIFNVPDTTAARLYEVVNRGIEKQGLDGKDAGVARAIMVGTLSSSELLLNFIANTIAGLVRVVAMIAYNIPKIGDENKKHINETLKKTNELQTQFNEAATTSMIPEIDQAMFDFDEKLNGITDATTTTVNNKKFIESDLRNYIGSIRDLNDSNWINNLRKAFPNLLQKVEVGIAPEWAAVFKIRELRAKQEATNQPQ
jgi:hypothetical protein